MSKGKPSEWGRGVKLLSLVFASLLWLCVMLERSDELKIQVPVVPGELPPGVAAVVPSPASVEVLVSGPRILLCRLPFSGISCRLDVAGSDGEGGLFTPKEDAFGLHPELKLVRVLPGSISFKLAGERRP